jgi:hypothetical protein
VVTRAVALGTGLGEGVFPRGVGGGVGRTLFGVMSGGGVGVRV